MRFTFVTLFDNLVRFYFEDSILKRAIQKGLLSVYFVNPRDFTKNRHKKVDDYQVGGGAGLVMTPQPLFDCLGDIKARHPDAHIVFATPAAKRFTQNDARRLAKKSHVVFVSGRYEGFDERVAEAYADEVFSIGDYILTGGELASLVMADAISRNVPGILGNIVSLAQESYEEGLLEAPSFSRPPFFENSGVPSELLKGNHSKISALRRALATNKTQYYRPDLFVKFKCKDK